ncbi:dermonecrotic toxin [Elysia marginata]|uniref:Dermonecrotic toxin n=1 Tax=Elysia marginata TaxID=1093978 RepID=A0AAV4FSK5_9GAST|nr:dermonecrotic toxin [Elysia marginata]
MADDGGWTDSENTPRIPDSRAIHRHILNPFVGARFVSVIDEIELKAAFAVSAEIALQSGLRFTVFHNTINAFTAGTYNHNVVKSASKEKVQLVTVKMGELKSASGRDDLFTEGMSYCSSFVLLSDFDKEKGIYKRRQMMHVPGSHLEESVKQEDGSRVKAKTILMNFLDAQKGEARKLIIVHGASNITEFSHEITLNQMQGDRCVIKEFMADPDVSVHQCNAPSIKVDATGSIVGNSMTGGEE